jgi:hypothetical protein
MRPKPRTLAIILGVIAVGTMMKVLVYSHAHDALSTADALNREKISRSLKENARMRKPELDYDRVYQGVLAEEARIAAEEEAARLAR